jgi:putative ABC transport system permease protein
MRFAESIRMALHSLGSNKMRAGLTMLGIIIGTGSVIALLAVGNGAQASITQQIQSIGSNVIFVMSGQMRMGGMQPTTLRTIKPLTYQDTVALGDPARTPHVTLVTAESQRSATVKARGQSLSLPVIGTTPAYESVRNAHTQYGSFFTSSDQTSSARVALLGSRTATDLFEDPAIAVGQQIRINTVIFRVAGVLESKGGAGFGGGGDSAILIPLSTMYKTIANDRNAAGTQQRVNVIYASAVDEASTDLAIAEMTAVLRERHDIKFAEDDFSVTSQKDILGAMTQITGLLTVFLGAIAGISLLVGGIGIMNIMLVSVTERTREIGLRKAVGAKRSDILWQFLVEAVVLSVLGGLIGLGLGWGIAQLVYVLAKFQTIVTMQAVALAISFSLAVGLFFGIYPASRAANLHPIDALRYE